MYVIDYNSEAKQLKTDHHHQASSTYFQCLYVIVGHYDKPGDIRTIPTIILRIYGARNRRDGPPPKITLHENDFRLIPGNPLHIVAPPPGELDGSLGRFHPRIHGEELIIAEKLRHEFLIFAKRISIKCS